MSLKKHGLSIGIDRNGSDFFLSLKAVGKLTHEDYEMITPMIDAALKGVNFPNVRVFIDGSELEGWEVRAAWDDLKLGLKHGSEFERIAIYGNKHWQERVAKIGSWFIEGEIQFFDDPEKAQSWLQQ